MQKYNILNQHLGTFKFRSLVHYYIPDRGYWVPLDLPLCLSLHKVECMLVYECDWNCIRRNHCCKYLINIDFLIIGLWQEFLRNSTHWINDKFSQRTDSKLKILSGWHSFGPYTSSKRWRCFARLNVRKELKFLSRAQFSIVSTLGTLDSSMGGIYPNI